jgi:diguanylate cyclase (GGDEF)-like protein/PAS domain S-box-containing protein
MRVGDKPPAKGKDALTDPMLSLYQRAEAALAQRAYQSPEQLAALSPAAAQRLLYDLQVHQIELEMQHEELQRAHAELDASHARYVNFFDLAPAGYCTVASTGLISEVNLTTTTLLNVAPSQMIKQAIEHFILEEDQDNYYLLRQRLRDIGGPQSCDLRLLKGGGAPFWAHLAVSRVRDHDGGAELRVVISDISERKRAETTLQLASNVFIHAREGITVTDADGIIVDVNRAFTRITGYGREEVLGQNPRLLQSGRQDNAFYVAMWRDLLANGHWSGEIWNKRKSGEIYPELLTITAVTDAQGRVGQYVGLFSDITERRQAEDKVNQLAFFDPLTKLPNRRTLSDRLGQTMASSKRSGRHAALMVFDLDNFKPLNDAYGHAKGDLLLERVAGRTLGCVREVDTVARIGGDEFVVMLGELALDRAESIATARSIAEKIRAALAAPYLLPLAGVGKDAPAVEYCCSASIGVVLFVSQEASQEEILRCADAAMYQAKAAGRNAIRFYGENGSSTPSDAWRNGRGDPLTD